MNLVCCLAIGEYGRLKSHRSEAAVEEEVEIKRKPVDRLMLAHRVAIFDFVSMHLNPKGSLVVMTGPSAFNKLSPYVGSVLFPVMLCRSVGLALEEEQYTGLNLNGMIGIHSLDHWLPRRFKLAPFFRSPKEELGDMGIFLVFLLEEERSLLPSSSSSSTSCSSYCGISPWPSSSFRRRRRSSGSSSSNRLLLAKAQSTISISAILLFIIISVFTLSTFEPASSNSVAVRRRSLSHASGARGFSLSRQWALPKHQFALQGMGTLYRRGTGAMNDLVVAHVTETASEDELRLFLRGLHCSGLMAKADLLLLHHEKLKGTASCNVSQFVRKPEKKSEKKETAEPLWGNKRSSRSINSSENSEDGDRGKLNRWSYGSVASFDSAELDPENSLAGFLPDKVPISLRRWACYYMLLGRLRRSFKHVMLVEARSSAVLLSDPLVRASGRRPELVYLLEKPDGRHGRKNPDKANQLGHSWINPGVIMGGAKGVRRLATAMLTEIVRAAMQQKRMGSFAENAVLSQLSRNEYLLKNVELVRVTEPTLSPPEERELAGA
ncbi:hypothetical protein SAY86_015061 [Trapa natans]|uniref:DUF7780 domain-containing protein n=1 Tax=Trapa natans TaxID=22666 RepID=A0AAN7QGI9_TRANT|nr:hypothetical protein SAY86_015061 [Trapa natans]